MRPLALVGLLSCLLQGILAVPNPSPTPPTRTGKKKRPLTEVEKILRIYTPIPPRAMLEDIPDDFNPSVNFTKRGDYPPYVDLATAFVEEKNPGINFDVANGYYIDPEGEAHVYFPQVHNGLDIANAAAQVSVWPKYNKVVFASNNFYRGELPEDKPLDRMDFRSPLDALQNVIATLKLHVHTERAYAEPIPGKTQKYVFRGIRGLDERAADSTAELIYFVQDGQIFLTWGIDLDMWWDSFGAYIDARTPSRIITAWSNSVNFGTTDAEFLVFPWGVMDPDQGNQELIKNPWTLGQTSRITWISDGHKTFNTTHGKNVVASGLDVDSKEYYPAFYTANMYHDVLYKLGFDEEHENFQDNNDGRGGPLAKDGDSVALLVHGRDPRDWNNALFVPSLDGERGKLILGLVDNTDPPSDQAFDAQIIIHEYTHGMTYRLAASSDRIQSKNKNNVCKGLTESRGLEEGWSDFMALAISVKDTQNRSFTFNEWQDPETRTRPYSTDYLKNDYTFASLNNITDWEEHYIGEVWATMMHEVMWNLIDKYGLSIDPFPELDDKGYPEDGKFLAMKLIIMSLRKIPCPPTFLSARDALLGAAQAYHNDTGHDAECNIWEAFAKRGMGWNAQGDALKISIKNSFRVPGKCDARKWADEHQKQLKNHSFRIDKYVEFRDELNFIKKKQKSEEAKTWTSEVRDQNQLREDFLHEVIAILSTHAPR